MTIAAAVSLVPRAAAMAAFRPAFMTADSFVYMGEGVSGRLGAIRPNGYPMFLSLFTRWPAALTVVIGLQHLMGIAIAVSTRSRPCRWPCLAAGMGFVRLRARRAERVARLRAGQVAGPAGDPSGHDPAVLP